MMWTMSSTNLSTSQVKKTKKSAPDLASKSLGGTANTQKLKPIQKLEAQLIELFKSYPSRDKANPENKADLNFLTQAQDFLNAHPELVPHLNQSMPVDQVMWQLDRMGTSSEGAENLQYTPLARLRQELKEAQKEGKELGPQYLNKKDYSRTYKDNFVVIYKYIDVDNILDDTQSIKPLHSVFKEATTPEQIVWLVENGFNPEAKDAQYYTAIDYFLSQENWPMVRAICETTPHIVFSKEQIYDNFAKGFRSSYESLLYHYQSHMMGSDSMSAQVESDILQCFEILKRRGLRSNSYLSYKKTLLSACDSLGPEHEKLLEFVLSLPGSPHHKTLSKSSVSSGNTPLSMTIELGRYGAICAAYQQKNMFVAEKIIAHYHTPEDMKLFEEDLNTYSSSSEKSPFIAQLRVLAEKYQLQANIEQIKDKLSINCDTDKVELLETHSKIHKI